MSETASNTISDITESHISNNQSNRYDILNILSNAYAITRQYKTDIVIPEHQRNKDENTIIILKRNPVIDGDSQIIAEMNVKTMTKSNNDDNIDNNDDDNDDNDNDNDTESELASTIDSSNISTIGSSSISS